MVLPYLIVGYDYMNINLVLIVNIRPLGLRNVKGKRKEYWPKGFSCLDPFKM